MNFDCERFRGEIHMPGVPVLHAPSHLATQVLLCVQAVSAGEAGSSQFASARSGFAGGAICVGREVEAAIVRRRSDGSLLHRDRDRVRLNALSRHRVGHREHQRHRIFRSALRPGPER